MPKLEAFDLATVQNCLHILNECEIAGITDIRFIRRRLADHIRIGALQKNVIMKRRAAALGIARGTTARPKSLLAPSLCPECGAMAVVPTDVEGERVLTCRKCRWSQYVGLIMQDQRES